MLQIKHLTITHKKDLRVMIKDFSFVLNPGDKAALIGEEGNGKSTLLNFMADPASVEGYAQAEGERICSGERLGFLPQELREEDREKTVYEYFCQGDFFLRTQGEQGELARELRLSPDFFYRDQKMASLSGGERVKAQMAGILAESPSVLLLDEPSNDVDLDTLNWLERLIISRPEPVLFISHDETLIERTANVVIHLEQLKRKTEPHVTIARTGYREYAKNRALGLERRERQALNERREEKKRREKFQAMRQKVESDLRGVSRQDPHSGYLLKKKMSAVKSMERRYDREAREMTERPDTEEAIFLKLGEGVNLPSGKTVVEFSLDRLTVPSTEGEEPRLLAKDIFLQIRGREKVCITGPNGAGKTTLLRQIARELLERRDLRAAYMPQDYGELLDLQKTPVEFLCQTGFREEETRIRTYLGSLKYTASEMDHSMSQLSGGQRAKVLLLKMSLSCPDVLLLDEPTRNFSPLSAPVIRELLRKFPGAIISISHDRKYVEEVCDKVYCLTPEGLALSRQYVPAGDGIARPGR